ncbi:MAG: hypothetical protein GY906_23075 [bacterium]|nr:hypothetical protein [bacterium]
MAQEKLETATTPMGEAAFCHIHKPDKKIWNKRRKAFVETDDKDKWRFKSSILLDKGTAANEEFVADLISRHEKAGGEGLPSSLRDGDVKPKKKKGEDQKDAPFPGQYEVRLKSKWPPALLLTNGDELPQRIKMKAGDTIAAVIAFDESDTEIYTGLVLYLNALVLVKKSKGHVEAARAAIKGAEFGDDVYIPEEGDEEDDDDEDESEEKGDGEDKSRRKRNY